MRILSLFTHLHVLPNLCFSFMMFNRCPNFVDGDLNYQASKYSLQFVNMTLHAPFAPYFKFLKPFFMRNIHRRKSSASIFYSDSFLLLHAKECWMDIKT